MAFASFKSVGRAAVFAFTGLTLLACSDTVEKEPVAPEASQPEPSQLDLVGDRFFPESLSAATDGTLYVGSLGTGGVLKFARGATTPAVFLEGGDPKGVTGVAVDSATSTLFLCAVDVTAMPPTTEVRSYDLASAAPKMKVAFPGFCADLALDGAGRLFVADGLGKVFVVAKGETTLKLWSSDPLLAPSAPPPAGFGADGIVVDGTNGIYVNTFSDGRLIHIPVNADGTAGAAEQIKLNAPLIGPDGMRMVDANTLIVVENIGGKLTKIALSGSEGTATVVASGLDMPTSVVKVGASYWVTEGQTGRLTGRVPGAPSLPFRVKRIPAL